ncbi:uncharacterized protein LOC101449949 [Ceratitis capitata]|uniref:Zinc finger C2HC domain-containing protein 1C n=1 Tax=Ceratitis capitata TaxID=7213 RepID=W8BE72_CERCA|nr:uncharacterized protein LOC101449949 [Ceratitis capitata]
MASQGVTAANSRLAQMQMRFQQKQQQEREQRRIEMTDESGNNVDEVAETKRITNGKVRQMFDDRRRGAGIDRANPLKPIAATSKVTTSVVRQAGGAVHNTLHTRNGNTTTVRTRVSPNVSGNTTQSRNPTKRMQNGNTEALTKEMSSLSLGLQSPVERNNNDVLGRVKSSNSLKLNPVVTKKSPSPAPPVAKGITNTTPAAPSTRVTPVSRPSSNSKTPKQRTAVISLKTPPRRTSGSMTSNTQHRMPSTADMDTGNMSLCRYCNRHFNAERLAKHEKICEKMAHTKRKIFDAARHRLRGTDAEKYVKKAQTRSSGKSGYSSAAAASGMSAGLKKNNWRKKHEEFIQAIRAAKQVQAHLARGGKLSDLPPPPPSENPDYIQCPHCSRRFNESAAERHIPRCATMLHNKPKPAQGTQRRR